MNSDGSSQTRLTTSSYDDHASWSPFFRTVSAGSVTSGSSGTATFSVTNRGGAALSVTGITVSGSDAAMFTVSPASFTINAGGAAQAVTVTFTPTSAGAKSASLSIAHNASGSPTSVTMTGNGTTAPVPVLELEVPSLGFEEVEVNKTPLKELFIKNTGTAVLNITSMSLSGDHANQFRFSPSTLTVQAGGRQSVQIVFAPTTTGDKLARLNITHNASGSPTAVPLTGKGVIRGVAGPPAFTPSALTFGNVKVGQPATQTLTVSNPGTLTLSVTRIATSGVDAAQFTVSTTQFDVAAGGSQQVTVTFTPTSAGAKTASLSITHNAAGSPSSIPLSGTGAVPDIDAPSSFIVGSAGVGQEVSAALRLLNRGTVDLTVRSLLASDAQFTVTSPPLPFTVSAGGFQDITVTFKPSSQGAKRATLTVGSDDPDEGTFSVSLTGTGTGVTVGVDRTAIDFGRVTLEQNKTETVNVVNSGNVDFSVRGITVTGGKGQFTVTSPQTFTVRGGASQGVNIRYAPTEADTASAILRIAGQDTTFVVGLSGSGVTQATASIRVVPAPPDSLLFGAVSVGSNKSFNVTIFNDGKATLRVNSIITTNAAYTASPDTLSVPAGGSRSVAVTFAPTQGGFFPAQIRISSNDPARPTATVFVSGVGAAAPPPEIEVTPRLLNFGNVVQGRSRTLSVIVTNVGGGTLRVVNVVTSHEDFTVSEATFSLTAGQEKVLTVTFLPSRSGAINEVLSIPSNSRTSPLVDVPLRATVGTGATGSIATLPASLDFGQVDLGKSQDLNLQIRNDGSGPLSVSNVTSDNDQVRVAPASLTVQPGQRQTVVVTYRPAPRRERQGNLVITSDDPQRPKITVPWIAQEPASERVLQVVAFSPQKDAVNVPEKAEIVVTFDEPILAQKKFVAVDAALTPALSSGDILANVATRDDGKTVVFPVTLAANTFYRFILFDATGVTGAKLGGPFDIAFTTGAAKPVVGSIAGAVSLTGGTLNRASVALFDNQGKLVSQAGVGKDGTYRLADLPAGTYQVFAQGELSDGTSATGTVDRNNDGRPDALTLAAGQNLTGVDVALKTQERPTPGVNPTATASLDLNTGKGNQKLAMLEGVKANQEIVLAVYAENVKDLTGFTATVEYDLSRVAFLGADAASGEGENLLRTAGGTALFTRPLPRENRVTFGGAILAPTSGTSPDGAGLLGVFRFATETSFTGATNFTLTRVIYKGLAGTDTIAVGAKATVTSEGGGPLTPKAGDGTGVLDLDVAAGDQNSRTLGGVRPGQKVDVQVILNRESANTTGFQVVLTFDPGKLKVVSGKGDGVFASAIFPGPPQVNNNAVTYAGSFLGQTTTARGAVAVLTFEALGDFSGDTKIELTSLAARVSGVFNTQTPGASVVLSSAAAGPTSDFNGSGTVDFEDFFLFAGAFNAKQGDPGFEAKFDLDNDGAIGFGDFFIFAGDFGKKAGKPAAKPAPSGKETRSSDARLLLRSQPVSSDRVAIQVRLEGDRPLKGYAFTARYDAEAWAFEGAEGDGTGPLFVARPDGAGGVQVAGAAAGGTLDTGRPVAEIRLRRLRGGGPGVIVADAMVLNAEGQALALNQSDVAESFATGERYGLGQNYPNPFNPETQIVYSLPEAGRVRLTVYNALGQEVRTLVDEARGPGRHAIRWDGRDEAGREVSSGVYLYRMEVGGFSQVHKMILLK